MKPSRRRVLAVTALPALTLAGCTGHTNPRGQTGPLSAIADIPLNYAGYGIVRLFFLMWIIALADWHFGHVQGTVVRQPHPAGAD